MNALDHLNLNNRLPNTIRLNPETGIPSMLLSGTTYLLEPGVYTTTGIELQNAAFNGFILIDPNDTVINFIPRLDHGQTPSLFTCRTYVREFHADGLRVNLGWSEFAGLRTQHKNSMKLTLFGALRCWQGKVNDFRVWNGGASGQTGGEYNESFIVRLDTYRGEKASENLPIPCVEICNGRIHTLHFEAGGYATACFTQTNQGTNAGDRFKIGTRESLAAHIHDIEITVPGGIGIGCGGVGENGGSERVLFERIKVTNGVAGHNMDTGSAYNIEIRDSEFRCSTGIAFTGASNGVKITNNVIVVGEPFWNKTLNRHAPQWIVRFKHNTSTFFDGNRVYTDLLGNDMSIGTYSGENTYQTLSAAPPINPPVTQPNAVLPVDNSQWVADATAKIESLQDAVKLLLQERDAWKVEQTRLIRECDGLKARIIDLENQLTKSHQERLEAINFAVGADQRIGDIKRAWATLAAVAGSVEAKEGK